MRFVSILSSLLNLSWTQTGGISHFKLAVINTNGQIENAKTRFHFDRSFPSLDLDSLDLEKRKKFRIELTRDAIYFKRGPYQRGSSLAISICEAITKCRLGGRFSPSIVILIVFARPRLLSKQFSLGQPDISVARRANRNPPRCWHFRSKRAGWSSHVEIIAIDKSTERPPFCILRFTNEWKRQNYTAREKSRPLSSKKHF